ncbi:tapasin-related protein-like [Acipenser oxyrinchus oxyrinchus]|uniref:Tapasin-related protein-like n=1 Tax=Acipenser oxyrinchus oxyrinchus TaxID=40147 RepID=A0AAD8G468_ACIOX|nr:tapasin-related protein-like [Acipenser oxyrinchus oxyrinchus]
MYLKCALSVCAVALCAILGIAGSDPDPSADPPAELRLVDIVLECSLVEEGGGRLSMFASAFSRQPATLVLRKVGVPEHETLDSYTEYQPPAFDPEALIFEVEVTSASIPGAESLLHADCNEQEVTCEISQYYPQDEVPETAWFICSLQVEGGGVSATMVMRTQPITGEVGVEPQKQKKLDLPLSDSGTIQLAAQFNVFTSMPSVSTALGGTVLLDCGFTGEQHTQEVQVEWRVQHKGNGRRVLHYRGDMNEGVSDRPGAQIDSARLAAHRNASLFLPGFRVADEGTYICIVTAGLYQAQQVIQVQVQEPPSVNLVPEALQLQEGVTERLSCEINRYYPLDVQVVWTQSPSSSPPSSSSSSSPPPSHLPHIYFSSHRQHSDGTYSLSAYVLVNPSTCDAGTTFTCSVSHPSLSEPLTASLTLTLPEESRLWLILGVSMATLIFIFAAYKLVLQWNKGTVAKKGQLKNIKVN